MAVPTERDGQLLASDEFELPDMNGMVAGVSCGPARQRQLDAVYFDSPDLALARAGVTLRHRSGEPGPSWTVKLSANSAGSALSRNELRFEGDADTVPAPSSGPTCDRGRCGGSLAYTPCGRRYRCSTSTPTSRLP